MNFSRTIDKAVLAVRVGWWIGNISVALAGETRESGAISALTCKYWRQSFLAISKTTLVSEDEGSSVKAWLGIREMWRAAGENCLTRNGKVSSSESYRRHWIGTLKDGRKLWDGSNWGRGWLTDVAAESGVGKWRWVLVWLAVAAAVERSRRWPLSSSLAISARCERKDKTSEKMHNGDHAYTQFRDDSLKMFVC